jgi:hypothetical protein
MGCGIKGLEVDICGPTVVVAQLGPRQGKLGAHLKQGEDSALAAGDSLTGGL